MHRGAGLLHPIARSFGAQVFDFPWIDDFAAARNEALARATGDYAFWLDADDVVDPPQREKLRTVLQRLRDGDEAGYVVRCAATGPDGTGGERSTTTSGSFRSGQTRAGRIACTSRFCRHCAGRRFLCAGPIWSCVTPVMSTRARAG